MRIYSAWGHRGGRAALPKGRGAAPCSGPICFCLTSISVFPFILIIERIYVYKDTIVIICWSFRKNNENHYHQHILLSTVMFALWYGLVYSL